MAFIQQRKHILKIVFPSKNSGRENDLPELVKSLHSAWVFTGFVLGKVDSDTS